MVFIDVIVYNWGMADDNFDEINFGEPVNIPNSLNQESESNNRTLPDPYRHTWPIPSFFKESQNRWKAFFLALKAVKLNVLWDMLQNEYKYPYKLETFQASVEELRYGRGVLKNPILLEILLKAINYPATKLFGQKTFVSDDAWFDDSIIERLNKNVEWLIRSQTPINWNPNKKKRQRKKRQELATWYTALWEIKSRTIGVLAISKAQEAASASFALWIFYYEYSSKRLPLFPHNDGDFPNFDKIIFRLHKENYPGGQSDTAIYINAMLLGYLGWTIFNYCKILDSTFTEIQVEGEFEFVPTADSMVALRRLREEATKLWKIIHDRILTELEFALRSFLTNEITYFRFWRDSLLKLAEALLEGVTCQSASVDPQNEAHERQLFFNMTLKQNKPYKLKFELNNIWTPITLVEDLIKSILAYFSSEYGQVIPE